MIHRGAVIRRSYLAILGLVMLPACETRLCAQPPKFANELFFSLKEPPIKGGRFDLAGPDAKELTKFEPAGLRITLPAGYPNVRPAVGVMSNVVIKGNFEITVRFEVLKDPEPADTADWGTRLALIVGTESKGQSTVKFSRSVRAKPGLEFLAFSAQWNASKADHDKLYRALPVKIKSGRMRLVRTDGMLSFQVADADKEEFDELRSYAFTTNDLNTVRVIANTDSPMASFDVRVSDWRIRMGAPAQQAAAAPVGNAPPAGVEAVEEKQAIGKGWLMALVLIGFTILAVLGISIGLGFYLLRGSPPRQSPVKN